MQPINPNLEVTLYGSNEFTFPFPQEIKAEPLVLIIFQYLNSWDQYRLAEDNKIFKNYLITEVRLDLELFCKCLKRSYDSLIKSKPFKAKTFQSVFEGLNNQINSLKDEKIIDLEFRNEFDNLHFLIMHGLWKINDQIGDLWKERAVLKNYLAILDNFDLGLKKLAALDTAIALRYYKSFNLNLKCSHFSKKCDKHQLELEFAKQYKDKGELERAAELALSLIDTKALSLQCQMVYDFILTLLDAFLHEDALEEAQKLVLILRGHELISQGQEKIVNFYISKNDFLSALELAKTILHKPIKDKVLAILVASLINAQKFSEAKEPLSLIYAWDKRDSSLKDLVNALLKNGNIEEAKNSLTLLKQEEPTAEFYKKFVDYYIALNNGKNAEIEIEKIEFEYERKQAHKKIIDFYKAQGMPEEAKRIAVNKLKSDEGQEDALVNIVEGLLLQKKIEEAEKYALDIPIAWHRHKALRAIVDYYIAEGNRESALKCAENFLINFGKEEILEKIRTTCPVKEKVIVVPPVVEKPPQPILIITKPKLQTETLTPSQVSQTKVEDKVNLEPNPLNQETTNQILSSDVEKPNITPSIPTSPIIQSKNEVTPEIKKTWFTLLLHRIAAYVLVIFNGIKAFLLGVIEAASRMVSRVTKGSPKTYLEAYRN